MSVSKSHAAVTNRVVISVIKWGGFQFLTAVLLRHHAVVDECLQTFRMTVMHFFGLDSQCESV